jgi:hypothetical protein
MPPHRKDVFRSMQLYENRTRDIIQGSIYGVFLRRSGTFSCSYLPETRKYFMPTFPMPGKIG